MVISGVNDTGEKREKKFVDTAEQFPVSTTPPTNFWLFGFSEQYQRHRRNINCSPVSTLIREYLREFSKKFKKAPTEYLGAWGTLIHEKKTGSRKSRVRLPLSTNL
jgi:hypothetical protein